MNVAASGGYYVALPADYIIAHPTSVTGSIGVIFLRPKVYGLMEKIGVDVAVNTSGQNKDMGSPFREATEEEKEIFQTLTDSLGTRFTDLVLKHRQIDSEKFEEITSARIFLAQEAKDRGLVDESGMSAMRWSRQKALRDCRKIQRWWFTVAMNIRMTIFTIPSPSFPAAACSWSIWDCRIWKYSASLVFIICGRQGFEENNG